MAFVSSSISALSSRATRTGLSCTARQKFTNVPPASNSPLNSAKIAHRSTKSVPHSENSKIPTSLQSFRFQLDSETSKNVAHPDYESTVEHQNNTPSVPARSDDTKNKATKLGPPQPRVQNLPLHRICIAISYISFLFYVAQHIPEVLSSEALYHLLKNEIDHVNNVLFSMTSSVLMSVFNFAILFNGGASSQPKWLPTKLFTVVFNIAGIVPYLCLRSTTDTEPNRGLGLLDRFLDGRILPLICMIVNIALYSYPLGMFSPLHGMWLDLSISSQLLQIWPIVQNDMFAFVTAVTFFGLSVFVADPLVEDMKRKGWFTAERKLESAFVALIVCMLPVLGPSMYLLFRPATRSTKSE